MTSFFFCIPLKSRRLGDDWSRVEEVFDRTLRSIFNQTDQDFTVLVGCHEVPDTSFSGRDNLHFLTLDHPIFRDRELARADRNLKMRRCAVEIHRLGGGYMFGVDSDDLVSNRIVQYARQENHPFGYIMQTGYEGRVETKTIRDLPFSDKIGPAFHQCCGTCAVLRFSPDDLPSSFDDTSPHVFDSFCSQHAQWKERSEKMGRPLATLPFPGAVYVVDTGIQLSRWTNNRGPRLRLNEILARPRSMTVEEIAEFGLGDAQASDEATRRTRR